MSGSSLPFEIRRGNAADLPAVVSLLNNAGLPTAGLAEIESLQLWLVSDGDTLWGVIALERFGPEALLRSLAVSPIRRQRGLGHKLVARLEHDAKTDGIERLVLLTETAEPFFRQFGYEVIDRHLVSEPVRQSSEFRSLCPASAICMRKVFLS